MSLPSEKTPLVPEGLPQGGGTDGKDSVDPAKVRLRRLHSEPFQSFLATGMDMDALRLSYASKLVLAAVEGRHVESAVDMLVPKGGFVNPLVYPFYRTILICVVMGHLIVAFWEGGRYPFPLPPAAAAFEAFAFLCYTAHVLLNLWTFGVKQYRDKRWHFTFTVLSICHAFLIASAAFMARWQHGKAWCGRSNTLDGIDDCDGWRNVPRLALLGCHALRPMMLISKIQAIRRVFANVLRTLWRTGSIFMFGAVALIFYSVLGINLFNSEQVSGYTAKGDNFDNFGGAILALFVLTTEENFPMVADPSFSMRPLVAFPFFVSFLLLFLVVILPLLLGIVLDAYGQEHVRQHARYRRKARNALLAAYYILDEGGDMGLSREQVVEVLTAKTGVNIDQLHAERLWCILSPDDDQDQEEHATKQRSYEFSFRSSSMPELSGGGILEKGPALAQASGQGRKINSSSRPAAPPTLNNAVRTRTRSPCTAMNGTRRGRVKVHEFLRLVELLHEKISDSKGEEEEGEEVEQHGGNGGGNGNSISSSNSSSSRGGFAGEHLLHAGYDGTSGFGFGLGPAREETVAKQGWEDEEVNRHQRDLSWGLSSWSTTRASPKNEEAAGGDGNVIAPGLRRLKQCGSRLFGQARRKAKWAVGCAWFPRVSQIITVLLTAMSLAWTPLSQKGYDRCLVGKNDPNSAGCRNEDTLRRWEGILLASFSAEMAVKMLAVGYRRLWRHWAHRFDLVVLGASIAAYVVSLLPGNSAALYVDSHPCISDLFELPRAMVVLRLLTAFPHLRRLLETMSTVGALLLKIMVLYSCVSYSFAAIGMAIFDDATSDLLDPRYSFSTLPEALLVLFFLTVTNNWNDLLYPLINSVRGGRWTALYFVMYMLFCATMMLDVLVGVVIEGFRVSTRGPQQELDAAATEGVPAHPSGAVPCKNGEAKSCDASVNDDNDSLSEESAKTLGGSQRARPAAPRRGLHRVAIQRKYKQVKPEDMFCPDSKHHLSQQDLRELEEAVHTVEERLHQAWVNYVRKTVTTTVGDSV